MLVLGLDNGTFDALRLTLSNPSQEGCDKDSKPPPQTDEGH
jgi:hypothetical protein